MMHPIHHHHHPRLFFIVFVFELRAEWPIFNVLRGFNAIGVPLKNSAKCSMIFLLMMRSISCSIGSFGAWVALNRCMKVETRCRKSSGLTPVVERSAGV